MKFKFGTSYLPLKLDDMAPELDSGISSNADVGGTFVISLCESFELVSKSVRKVKKIFLLSQVNLVLTRESS
jgi:hypothetical protein